jgi:hypothetical protein
MLTTVGNRVSSAARLSQIGGMNTVKNISNLRMNFKDFIEKELMTPKAAAFPVKQIQPTVTKFKLSNSQRVVRKKI